MGFCVRFAYDFCTNVGAKRPVAFFSDHFARVVPTMKSATNHQKVLQQPIEHLFV